MSEIRINKTAWFSIAFLAATSLKADEELNLYVGKWETLVTVQTDE